MWSTSTHSDLTQTVIYLDPFTTCFFDLFLFAFGLEICLLLLRVEIHMNLFAKMAVLIYFADLTHIYIVHFVEISCEIY